MTNDKWLECEMDEEKEFFTEESKTDKKDEVIDLGTY